MVKKGNKIATFLLMSKIKKANGLLSIICRYNIKKVKNNATKSAPKNIKRALFVALFNHFLYYEQ